MIQEMVRTDHVAKVYRFGSHDIVEYRAPVYERGSERLVRPPLGGGGWVTLTDLRLAGYPVVEELDR